MTGRTSIPNLNELEGVGLLEKKTVLLGSSMPAEFETPKWFDNRGWHAPTDNQGNQPACVGYAIADYLEVRNWRRTGRREQVDAMKIYLEAKKIDGDNNPGTALSSGMQAAQRLGHFPAQMEYEFIATVEQVFYAMHRNFVVIAGFMIDQNWYRMDTTGFIGKDNNAVPKGGHAVVICSGNIQTGDPEKDWVGVHNQWGKGWGCGGFGRMTVRQFNSSIVKAVLVKENVVLW